MALKLDMDKSAGSLRLSLEKSGVVVPEAEVGLDFDVSGSFERAYLSGLVQKVLQRLLPWAMVFDPDKKADVFTFSDGAANAVYVGEVTPDTCEDYVERNITRQVRGFGGGTDYSYVLERNLQHFGWIGGKRSWNPFARKTIKRRSIMFFATDGECNLDDRERTRQVLDESEKRKDQVYFILLGLGGGSTFPFLTELADRFGNTGLSIIKNVESFVAMDDDAMNELLVGDELLGWLKK